jgi:hypothetical protein
MAITWLIYYTVIPILGGLLAASGFILSKKPDAKVLLDKIAPYQGFIGLAMFVDGIINIGDLLHVGAMLSYSKLIAITIIIVIPSLILVGFMLGFSLAAKYLFKGGSGGGAQEKAGAIQAKLAGFSAPLGFASIIGGFLCLLIWLHILK